MKRVSEGKLVDFEESCFTTLEERVWRLESIRAIKECIYYYTKSADIADPDGMAACFTDGGQVFWHPDSEPAAKGRENLRIHFQKATGMSHTQEHFCTNFQIFFKDRCKAVGECNIFSWQIWKDVSKPATICSGRYEFEAQIENGTWRLASLCLALNAKFENGSVVDGREREQFNRPWPPMEIGNRK